MSYNFFVEINRLVYYITTIKIVAITPEVLFAKLYTVPLFTEQDQVRTASSLIFLPFLLTASSTIDNIRRETSMASPFFRSFTPFRPATYYYIPAVPADVSIKHR